MIILITAIAQYVSVILLAVYGWLCFSIFGLKDSEKREKKLTKQIILVFAIHFLWYLILYLRLQDFKIILLYGAEILVAVIYMMLYHYIYPYSSRLITNNMCFLMLLGYTLLTRINLSLAIKQFAISTFSLMVVSFIPMIMIRYRHLRNYYLIYGFLGILSLMTVFIPGEGFIHGIKQYGARNWLAIDLSFVNISLQPSEFVKILFVFFVASTLIRCKNLKQIIVLTIFSATHVGILVLEKDLGGALIFFTVYVLMVYIHTNKLSYLLSMVGGTLLAAGFAFLLFKERLFNHVVIRVKNWIDPWNDIENKSYQIAQSLFAIGSGGWLGSGLGAGSPEMIPIRESDFIFSVIAEELGGLAALIVILICFSIFLGIIDVALHAKGLFYKNMAFGFAIIYVVQVLLNIGGVTKFIPSTGVTLPLISYGLSSVTSTLIIFQIIQGINSIVGKEADFIEREKEKINSIAKPTRVPAKRKTTKRKEQISE